MIELELFLIFLALCVLIWVVNKKQSDPVFTIQKAVTDEVRAVKKAWVKRDKYKPYVNDDHKAWLKENSK